ncbi:MULTISPECIES: hypothetical protein [Kitasatospora]|uniref:Putative membrane protein n=1 Tax=Kitasatospora setae (strain ATCC 33774 / DSM 43861 / JCM 3304 / KCC A-0304 / NBRC 14216 / KM-6054) TaxID=452652 RepID=E4N4N0_KITSK|nr:MULTISPECIES: hypothetical protein [Kitasatospora]BAJ26161.1 putative membrane protein [Kitasatospora setae KM-6054]
MSTPAPWVRTRLRTAPTAAALTAVLALALVFLAAALPRALDRGADGALRDFLRGSGPVATSVGVTSGLPVTDDPSGRLDETSEQLTGVVGAVLPLDPSGPVYGRRAKLPRSLPQQGLTEPDGVPPEVALQYQHGARERVRFTEGRWPAGAGAAGEPAEVALSAAAARTLGIKVGDVFRSDRSVLDRGYPLKPMPLRVAGLYEVTDPADPFWAEIGCALKACLNISPSSGPADPPHPYWYAVGLVGTGELPRLGAWGSGAEDYWRLPVRVDALRADRLEQTSYALAAVTSGPVAVQVTTGSGRSDVRIASALRTAIDGARQRQASIDAITAVGPAGAAGVAAVVLCLAAALTVERRTPELRLLRARGAGLRGVFGRLLGEGLATVLPAAGLGALAAFVLLPTPRWQPAAVAAGSVALLALLALPVRAALLLRVAPDRARGGRRRLVAELAVLAVTAAAAVQLARRGVSPLDAGVDPLLVAAPLLLSLSGALLLARAQPVLIGLLARRAARRSGAVGFLGLARAARGGGGPRSRPSVLPLLALVLAVACGAVGATVLASVAADRTTVARHNLGGDAVVSASLNSTLPDAFVTRAGQLPGVTGSLPVWIVDDVTMSLGAGASVRVNVVIADPVGYARLADAAGRGRFDPALLTGGPGAGTGAGGGDGRLPALVSGDLPEGEFELRLQAGDAVRIRTAGTVDGTPALTGTAGQTVLLPLGAAADLLPRIGGPTRWLADGSPDDARLRALAVELLGPPAAGSRPGHLVRTTAEEVALLGHDPLQASAVRLFWLAVGATALFALLAVLLTLLRAGPERAATLARLRTMGLRPRQGLALILAEVLPQSLVAALGGALTAVGCVLLLGPALDLSPLVGAGVPTGLHLLAAPIARQAVLLALLAALAVVAEAAVTARRQITTELRAGDTQ